jgi:hypothetical protein
MSRDGSISQLVVTVPRSSLQPEAAVQRGLITMSHGDRPASHQTNHHQTNHQESGA